MKISKPTDFNKMSPITEGLYEVFVSEIKESTITSRFGTNEGLSFFFIIRDGEFKGRRLYTFVNPKLTPKAKLTTVCKAIIGREFTAEELAVINETKDLSDVVLGRPLRVYTVNNRDESGSLKYRIQAYFKTNIEIDQKEIDEAMELYRQPIETFKKKLSDEELDKAVDELLSPDAPKAEPK